MRVTYRDNVVEVNRAAVTKQGHLEFSVAKELPDNKVEKTIMYTVTGLRVGDAFEELRNVLHLGYIDITGMPGVVEGPIMEQTVKCVKDSWLKRICNKRREC